MHNERQITKDLYWIGVNDRRIALFENVYPVPNGISYNSYILLDEKTVLFDVTFLVMSFWLIAGYVSCYAIDLGYNRRGVSRILGRNISKNLY